GTVGGSIAHADPAAELPLVFRALDGEATVLSQRGGRTVPASEFFLYVMSTVLEPDELLTELWFPLPLPGAGQAFVEVARRHGDFALVSAAASMTLEGETVTDVAIGIGGAGPVPVRASAAEGVLRGERLDARLLE